MPFIEFLSSAAGGAIAAPVIKAIGNAFHVWLVRPKEVELEVKMMTAKRNAETEKAAWDAFAASQQSNVGGLSSIPAGAHPWVVNIYMLVDAARQSVRPALTFLGLPLAAWVYYTLANPAATASQIEMAKEINFMVFMMWSWWFGERYVARSRQPIDLVKGGK
jgi:hypothetical protein